ncbi:MAG: hypothetical protein ACRBN8_09800 [Nannocystales bacterium]
MRESLLVVVAIIVLLTTAALEPVTAIGGGLVVAIGFLLLGSLAGGLYHLRLHQVLTARDALPPRWWVDPTKLHKELSDAEREKALPAFYAGAAAFGVCVLGCVSMVSGLARVFL